MRDEKIIWDALVWDMLTPLICSIFEILNFRDLNH
jgi:hypothetical protein